MEFLRNWLLQNAALHLYESILDFLKAPDHFESQTIISCAPMEIREHLQNRLNEVMHVFATDRALYRANYTYGQIIVWNEVLRAYRILDQQKNIIENITLSPDVSN